jgi:putative phosphoesterase
MARPSKRRSAWAPQDLVHRREVLRFDRDPLCVVAVADTHGRPHPMLGARIAELGPAHILHAGDVGGHAVLQELEKHAPVTAVRGNIDGHEWPDVVTLEVRGDGGALLRILLTHVAVAGLGLRADVARMARAEEAVLVVCGHSHVPFAANDRGITVYNPGSVGPRRFHLPIVLGVIDVSAKGVALRHVDCETGEPWRP